jgi:hypothetical protein
MRCYVYLDETALNIILLLLGIHILTSYIFFLFISFPQWFVEWINQSSSSCRSIFEHTRMKHDVTLNRFNISFFIFLFTFLLEIVSSIHPHSGYRVTLAVLLHVSIQNLRKLHSKKQSLIKKISLNRPYKASSHKTIHD